MKLHLCILLPVSALIFLPCQAGSLQAQESSWPALRSDRAHVVKRYLTTASDGYDWFTFAAHGRESGVPFLLLRLLPELAPDIWGEPADRFRAFGYFDTFETKDRPLPLGLGWVQNPVAGDKEMPKLHRVTLTCAACHIGRVRVSSEEEPQILVRAPNTEIDVRKYRHALQLATDRLLTAARFAGTVDRLKKLIAEKPAGFFFAGRYQIGAKEEEQERQFFVTNIKSILLSFAQQVAVDKKIIAKQLATSYSRLNAPPLLGGTPGQSDGSGDLLPKLLLMRELANAKEDKDKLLAVDRYLKTYYPELPHRSATATDNLSVWNQRDRPYGQLDGSVKAPLIRNIAAQVAVVGSSHALNVRNADLAVSFTARLPAPLYPFFVDLIAARRGEEIFKRHCLDCHKAGNGIVYGINEIGTDMNRARVLSVEGRALFLKTFLDAIPAAYEATSADGVRYRPADIPKDDVLNDRTRPDRQGYVAGPLDGIWARAPYLHNGSVPTLRHLLAPNNSDSRRPLVFLRGVIDYDVVNVGFVWQMHGAANLRQRSPTAAVFDTRWDGASHLGHDRDTSINGKRYRLNFSGVEHRSNLEDLLEYLKTL